jgi:excisionase family DNA binding protein
MTEWLSLKDAAARLAVHPTTLRRWADNGAIGVMVTPGGHRRFDSAEITRFAQTQHVRRRDNVQSVWAENALQQTRQQITRQPDADFIPTDLVAKQQLRSLGQRLIGLAMQYMAADSESDGLLVEAEEIGRVYGTLSQAIGLSLTDALRASLFFHQQLLESSLELPENARVLPATNRRILRRINRLLNTVHLGIAAMYA